MIQRKFVAPNYRCRVRDVHGTESTLLKRGTDEGSVRSGLEARGYTVLGVEPYDFQDWLERAKAETEKAIAAGGKDYEFRAELWKELKLHLFDLFEGKCAYCEACVQDVAFGEVEHYRPKRQVEECPDHPGYYWLAYDLTNLLPSCQLCNGYPAKMNHFPVRDKAWARRREEMEREKPLLLNPYLHNPREHLRFRPLRENSDRLPLSQVEGRTEEGKTSVEVLRLNRPNLASARALAQQRIRQQLMAAFFTANARAVWQRLFTGQEEFSSAALAEAESLLAELQGEYQDEKSRTGEIRIPAGTCLL
ncbi:MAG TPA: hypothetical protein VH394_00440 [Thermoanaerobaculia bacterium]|nr:hypothetical protein [Thermoanaerobaculia bacterium]